MPAINNCVKYLHAKVCIQIYTQAYVCVFEYSTHFDEPQFFRVDSIIFRCQCQSKNESKKNRQKVRYFNAQHSPNASAVATAPTQQQKQSQFCAFQLVSACHFGRSECLHFV